jgi:ornithine cyclodeaminase
LRWVAAEELRAGLDLASLIDALESGHKGARPELSDSLIGPDSSRYMIRSAHDGGIFAGSKLITIVPDNPEERALPSIQAVIVLFDANNGAPMAALDATELTYWKTSADSALGSKLLSRRDARVLVMAGAGALAPWLVRAHLLARPGLEKVLLWNRTPARAQECVSMLRQEGITAQTVDRLEDAVRQADIISTATMAREPILHGSWLKPGVHVDLAGGYSPDTREADDETLLRARLFVDCRESALAGVGDILTPLKSGVIELSDIVGDLYDLVQGRVSGRSDEKDITLFKNAGGAHLDLMAARAVLDRLGKKP